MSRAPWLESRNPSPYFSKPNVNHQSLKWLFPVRGKLTCVRVWYHSVLSWVLSSLLWTSGRVVKAVIMIFRARFTVCASGRCLITRVRPVLWKLRNSHHQKSPLLWPDSEAPYHISLQIQSLLISFNSPRPHTRHSQCISFMCLYKQGNVVKKLTQFSGPWETLVTTHSS